MVRQSTVGGVPVLDLVRALRHAGVQPAPLCRAVELDLSSLEDPDARVATRTVKRLLALAEKRSHDPWIGLHAGERAEPRGPLFYLMLSSSRLAEGLRRAERFAVLAADTLRLTVRVASQLASLIVEVEDATLSASRHAMEYMMMALVRGMRHAIGGEFLVEEVHFRHQRSGSHEQAERAFGCPVRFGQPDARVVFPRAALQTAPRFANRAIAEEIERFAIALSARLAPRRTAAERVTQVVRELLAAGVRPDCARIAAKLGVGRRTLQRKLADERTSLRALRDSVLWKTVEALLSNPSLKVEAIALSVGFSDLAAFSKAFHRRRGLPPTHYREALLRTRALPRSLGSFTELRRRSSG
jgi:AraC-like DNA-binding protein